MAVVVFSSSVTFTSHGSASPSLGTSRTVYSLACSFSFLSGVSPIFSPSTKTSAFAFVVICRAAFAFLRLGREHPARIRPIIPKKRSLSAIVALIIAQIALWDNPLSSSQKRGEVALYSFFSRGFAIHLL